MRNLRKFQPVKSILDDDGTVLWVVDTPEKKLLFAILQQAVLDLYSYVKHGIIINRNDKRQFKSKKKNAKTTTASDELLEFFHDESMEIFSLNYILEHLSTDLGVAKKLVHKARDSILSRKFDCAVLLKDFSQMV